MPINENFFNPYRIVNLPSAHATPQQDKLRHARFSGISGTLTAELLTLTPLVIGGRAFDNEGGNKDDEGDKKKVAKAFMHTLEDGRPVIPGSSLKGVMKFYCELFNGPLPVQNNIFGSMDSKGDNNDHGRINFGQAELDILRSPDSARDARTLHRITTVLGTPKKHHVAFYGEDSTDRCKLYHHQPKVKLPNQLQRLAPGHKAGAPKKTSKQKFTRCPPVAVSVSRSLFRT